MNNENISRDEIIKAVEERVKKELEGKVNPDMFGYIHIFENRKKEILKQEYGINITTTREESFGRSID